MAWANSLEKWLPDSFFAIKATIKPLASTRRLFGCFSLAIVLSALTFGILFFYYFEVSQLTSTIISNTILDGYTCKIISAMPARTVRYPCHNEGSPGIPRKCMHATGFGGRVLDSSTQSLLQRNFIDIEYTEATLFSSHEDCMQNYECPVPETLHHRPQSQVGVQFCSGKFD